MSQLNPALASLVQHVELNRTGWWDKSIRNIITTYLWAENKSKSFHQLEEGLEDTYSTTFETTRLKDQLEELIKLNQVLAQGDSYTLSQSCRSSLNNNNDEFEKLLLNIEGYFYDCLEATKHTFAGTYEEIWNTFNDGFLLPTVRDLGARTYSYIFTENLSLGDISQFDDFLNKFRVEDRTYLSIAVKQFLDPNNKEIRLYIFQALTVYFMVQSGKLSKDHINDLSNMMRKKVNFKILLDTNLLFYWLDLDGGDFQKTVNLLKKIINNVSKQTGIKFYVHAESLEEFKSKINYEESRLSSIRNTPKIISSAYMSNVIGGIEGRYFQEVQKANGKITPSTYFRPFKHALLSLLRDNDIEIFREDVTKLKNEDSVKLDIAQLNDWWGKRKNKKAIEHDVVMWHFIKTKREDYVNSPIDAVYWFATLDFSLINFDKHKSGRNGNNEDHIPICITPTSLVQMLQLWLPRTEDFERALISSIRPFLTTGYDAETEQTAMNILGILSRFEDVSQIPEQTIVDMMHDDVLRQKLFEADKQNDVQIEIIKSHLGEKIEAINQENKALEKQTKELKTSLNATSNTVSEINSNFEQSETERIRLENENKLKLSKISILELEKSTLEDEKAILIDENLSSSQRLSELEANYEQLDKDKELTKFAILSIISIIFSILLGFLVYNYSSGIIINLSHRVFWGVTLGIGFMLLTLSYTFENHKYFTQDTKNKVKSLTKWFLGVFILAILL